MKYVSAFEQRWTKSKKKLSLNVIYIAGEETTKFECDSWQQLLRKIKVHVQEYWIIYICYGIRIRQNKNWNENWRGAAQ